MVRLKGESRDIVGGSVSFECSFHIQTSILKKSHHVGAFYFHFTVTGPGWEIMLSVIGLTRIDNACRDNPVKNEDAQQLLQNVGISLDPSETDDFKTLLAACHDCAEFVENMPDYQPRPDLTRYPRQNVRRPTEEEQDFGHAWVHKFLIKGNPNGGLLAGKTVSLKDVIAVAGVPQFQGSDVLASWTPTTDATVVTRVLDAGADIVGTTNCENFCHSTSSFTSAQGVVDNPYAPGYSAGGSTSGGAALVGAGLVDVTIGGDQGGSIRVPAALSGCMCDCSSRYLVG